MTSTRNNLAGPAIFALALALASLAAPALAEYEFVTAFGSFGTANGQFDSPRGVAQLADGRIVVTESGNHRVQLCTEQGVCSDFGEFGVETGFFDRPRGVAVNSANRIVVADRGNDRIQVCLATGSCDDFGGSGTAVGKFNSPRGVAIASGDRIVVTDTDNNRIQICTEVGICSAFGTAGTGLGQFSSPAGVAVDSAGRIIVADRGNNRIQLCSEAGACTAFGSPGSGPGQFDSPAGVAVDSQDRIVVVDRFNDRVQVCSDNGSCTAFGSLGAGNGQFNLPWGVAVDSLDRIVVADLGNHRIQIFAETQAPVTIDAFTASPNPIEAGQSVLLSWSVSNAASCTPLNGTPGWQAQVLDPAGGNVSIQVDMAGDVLFTIRCTDGSTTVSRSVTVTVNAAPSITINAGLNDAWFNLATGGQGFFVNVFPVLGQVFVAWFTFDTERPDPSVVAILGEPGHRWITAFGPFTGNTATLAIEVTSGGVFNSPDHPVTQVPDGTLTLVFHSCNSATISYDIPSLGLQGSIDVQRIANDNVALCEALAPPG